VGGLSGTILPGRGAGAECAVGTFLAAWRLDTPGITGLPGRFDVAPEAAAAVCPAPGTLGTATPMRCPLARSLAASVL